MNPIMYNIPTNKKGDKHIQFDLSKNQTYIIDNNESISGYSLDYIPIITMTIVILLLIAATILAYVNNCYVCAGVYGVFTITFLVYLIYTSNYTFILDKIYWF